MGDIVVAMSSATDNAMTDNLAPGFRLSPCCDYYIGKYMRVDPDAYVGQMVSNDYFYNPNLDWFKPFLKMNVLP